VFLFLDEHPDTIDDGFYMIRLGRYEWSNVPASFHNGAANVSFADGHAETHRWLVTGPRGTVRPAVRGAVKGDFAADPRTDYLWIMERMSELKAR
jgi:prepilin-type processing-associated H-X9-DG protein